MRLVALALALGLAGSASAEEVLVLADGTRITVASYEVQAAVVVIRTTDGKLRSFPRSYVDLEATEGSASPPPASAPAPAVPAEASPSVAVPRDGEARVRWALEHYGARSMLEMFQMGLDARMGEGDPSVPAELNEELARALSEPFQPERVFEEAAREFSERAAPRSVQIWTNWLDSPTARRVMAGEAAEGKTRSAPPPSPARAALVRRLLDAGHPIGAWYELLMLGLGEMANGFRNGTEDPVGGFLGDMDWSQLDPESTEKLQAQLEAELHAAYESLSDAELLPYVRFWESPDGREIARALRESLTVAYRSAGHAAGEGLVSVYQAYLGVSEPTSETLRFAEHNFEFTPPADGWAPMEVQRIHQNAVVGFLRHDPQMIFMILAEHDPGLSAISSEGAAAVARANLQAASKEFRFLSEEPHAIGGMNGVLMLSENVIAGQPTHYVHWIHSGGGSVFQLVAWATKTQLDLDTLTARAKELYGGFDLLEHPSAPATPAANVTVVADEAGLLSDRRSPRFGYSLRLDGAGWSPWEDLAESAPDADAGGLGPSSAFLVVPVYLDALDPSMDALSSALLKRFDIDASQVKAGDSRDISDAARSGRAIGFQREVEEVDYTYRFHVWKGERMGYLVAAWSDSGDVAPLDDLLARFDYDPAFAPPASFELDAREREWHGTILHDIGVEYFEDGQLGSSAAFFQMARDLKPGDPDTLLFLLSALTQTSRFEEALVVWEAGAPGFAEDLLIQSYRPFLLSKLDRREEAVELYRSLFERGYQNDSDLYDFAELLVDLDRAEEAIAEVSRYREDRDSVTAARLEALLHVQAMEPARAIDILEAELVLHPGDTDVAVDLLDAYYEAGRYRDAVAKAASLSSKVSSPEAVRFQAGRSLVALGELDEAKASFEAVLDLDPSHAGARDFLDYVSGLLGQGDHEVARHPVEAVPLPAAFSEAPQPTAEIVEASREYGAFYLDRSTALSFEPGEDYRLTERYVVRITDPKAIAAFSSFRFELDPVSERIFVNELRVTDAAGETVAEGDLSTFYVTDDTGDGMATSDKLLNVPVPGLSVGHTLTLTVTTARLSSPTKMPFRRHSFSSGYPAVRSSLYLRGGSEALRHHSGHGVSEPARQGDGGLLWVVEAPPLYRIEGYSERVERYLPFTWIGSSEESWEAIGREYLADIEERLVLDDAIRDLALELVEGLDAREARVEALADYVQESLTYKAIEFGRRAWMPSPASDVVSNRYGDCKDHAVLFYLLLRAVDEDAELALVSTETEIRAEVPSMEQFDHMIVFVPGYRGGHFFDLTDKNHDVASLPPLGLGGREALLLSPGTPKLVTIPDYPSNSSRARAVRELTVEGEDLVVSEVISFEGYYSGWLRAGFRNGDQAARRERVLRYLDSSGRITVEELAIDNLTEAKEALVLRIRYRLHGAMHEADDKLIGRLPASWEKTLLDVPWEPDRRTPFRVAYPLRLESEVRVAAPEGYVIASKPSSVEAAGSGLFDWRVSSEISESELVVRLETHRPRTRGTAEEYGDLATTVSKLLDAAEPSLVLARR